MIPENWKTIKLTELLNPDEIVKVRTYMNTGNWTSLKGFLQERRKKLEARGVLPDYLFYYLQWFKKRSEVV